MQLLLTYKKRFMICRLAALISDFAHTKLLSSFYYH